MTYVEPLRPMYPDAEPEPAAKCAEEIEAENLPEDLWQRLSRVALECKAAGEWQLCDLLREARDQIMDLEETLADLRAELKRDLETPEGN